MGSWWSSSSSSEPTSLKSNERNNKSSLPQSSQSYSSSIPRNIENKSSTISNVQSKSSSSINDNRPILSGSFEPQRPTTSYNYLEDRLKDNNQIYRSREQSQRRISSYQYPYLASSTYKAPQGYQTESSRYRTYHSSISREDNLPLKAVKDEATKNKRYEFTNEDAKIISKKGFQQGDQKYTVEECRTQMKKQMHKLNTEYKYSFTYREQPREISHSKKMTRTIYLSFVCNSCNKQNRWTSIGGTFQVTFKYENTIQTLTQCQHCLQYIEPKVYKTQMEAMKMFFSVIVTNIMDNVPPPEKPEKYYIRENHWHKKEWCEACKLGKCTTQNRK